MAASADPNKTQLKLGLEAAKNKDYAVAIAHLRQVKPSPSYEQAQQALVIALGKTGQTEAAIARCQPLLNSAKPKTRQWAKSSLAKLQNRATATVQDISPPTSNQPVNAGESETRNQPKSPAAPAATPAPQQEQAKADIAAAPPKSQTQAKTTAPPASKRPAALAKLTAFIPPILKGLGKSRLGQSHQGKSRLGKPSAPSVIPTSRDLPPTAIQSPTLPFNNAPAPQRWKPLPPLATSRWSWAGLFMLSLWALRLIKDAQFWPSFIVDYSIWVVGVVGAIAYGIIWINHRNLARSIGPLKLRLQEILTILAIGWLVPFSIPTAIRLLNSILKKIPFWNPYIQPPSDLKEVLLFVGLPILMALPWTVSFLLRLYGPWQTLTPEELEAISPATKPLLRKFFRSQHNVKLPKLLCIDSPIPLITSYGHRPRNARIILSQGLIARLNNEQIAALIAGELGHINSQTFVVLPWLNAFLQLPFGIYGVLFRIGNICQTKLKTPMDAGWRFLYRSGLVLSGLFGAIAYGFFKLWRWPLLWISRQRLAYGDRTAVNLLGDPNTYSRALMAYGQALSDAVATTEQTPPILEAFELVLPLGLPDALTASFAPTALPREERFGWDAASPYRRWLSLNNSHEPLGDRLAHIASYAKPGPVSQEVELATQSTSVLNPFAVLKAKANQRRKLLNETFATWKPLLYQGFPFYGAVLGLALGFGLWALGATVSLFGGWWFDWVYGDRQLLWGCIPLGVGIGLIIRTNDFFPQRASREGSPVAAVQTLMPDPSKLPIAAEPVEFSGKLVGRPGVANWLGQDLLLLSEQGPLRLHWCSPLGPAGNLWPKFLRPSFLLNREVIVSGWLRRGATLWLDVEQIRTANGGKSSQRGHPMWAAVMAGIAILWSIVILLPTR